MFGFIKRRFFLLVILLLIAGFIGWRIFKGQEDKYSPLTVVKTDLTEMLSFSGEVDASEKSTMTFQSTGKLSYIKVKEGDGVKRGQLLAGLDTGDLAAAERKAYYEYLAADANAKEVEDQVKDHDKDESFSQKNDRVTAQTARDIKYDAWLTAQRALRYATLYSPINGIVYSIPPTSPGEFITATNTVAFEIINPQTVFFSASADQTDVTKIKVGTRGEVTLDSFPDDPLPAVVYLISFTPKADEIGTVYQLKIGFGDGKIDERLRLGMTGDFSFVVQELKDVITVPTKYIKSQDGERYVVKAINGRMVRAKITTGDTIEGETVIVEGINEGDVIYDQTL